MDNVAVTEPAIPSRPVLPLSDDRASLRTLAAQTALETRKAAMALQGEYLKHLREAAGMTQFEVAKAIGFDKDTMVGHWETGRCWCAAAHHVRLADALGVDPTNMVFRLTVFRNLGLARLAQRTPDQLMKHAQDSEATARRVDHMRNLNRNSKGGR